MSWINEIYRAFFVAFGAMEVITNLTFLVKSNGAQMARKQHQEIPRDISDNQLKVKVLFMLSFGVLFLCIGSYSYFARMFSLQTYLVSLGLLSIYAILEAFYYKYWKTLGFALISISLFSLLFFLN